MIDLMSTDDVDKHTGLLIAVLFFVFSQVRSLFSNTYQVDITRVGYKCQTALTAAIHKKVRDPIPVWNTFQALNMSNSFRKQKTVGDIVNMMASDVEKFRNIAIQHIQLWTSPFQIALTLYCLYSFLGMAALPGILVIIILVPINVVSSSINKRWQVKHLPLFF